MTKKSRIIKITNRQINKSRKLAKEAQEAVSIYFEYIDSLTKEQ